MTIKPSVLTAALAGAFSALALPFLRAWIGGEGGLNLPFAFALLLTVAIPAHAFVVGFHPSQAGAADDAPSRGAADTALLKRIGAWLGAAAVVTAVRLAIQ